MQYPSIDHMKQGLVDGFQSDQPEASENHRWYLEEKIDGSQLSMRLSRDIDHELVFTCRNKKVNPGSEPFRKACEMLLTLKNRLYENFVYHGEAVCKPRHNVIQYKRVPRFYFVCYDIYNATEKRYLSPEEKIEECNRIGLEHAPILYYNDDRQQCPYSWAAIHIESIEQGRIQSLLGGMPEGVVLKHHHFYNKKGKYSAVKLKMVSEEFQERHRHKQPKQAISCDDFVAELGKSFATPARFHKAVQHLRESGTTEIIQRQVERELDSDFSKEYEEEMKVYLWQELGPLLKQHARTGLKLWIQKSGILGEQQPE